MKKALLVILALLCVQPMHAFADAPAHGMIIDRSAPLSFTPQSAFFVVQFDDRAPMHVPAVIVPPFRNETPGDGQAKWLIGAHIAVPADAHNVSSFGFVLGSDKSVAALPPLRQQIERGNDSAETLQTRLTDRKTALASLKLQLAEQESSLRRLRDDAEVIGNLGRVTDAQDETARIRAASQSIDHDIENLERFIRLTNSYPAPMNYREREQQLTVQLTELADAAKKAERGEGTRREQSDESMRDRLHALEASRESDIPQLEEQLSILRSEKKRLESGAPAPTENAEPTATADEL